MSNKRWKPYRFNDCAGFVLGLTAAIALSLQPSIARERNDNRFSQWCERRANLSAGAKRTVEVLLEIAGTSECNAAEEKLLAMSDLSIVQKELTDLSPLSSLTHLTSLSLPGNQITDIRPLAKLENLAFLILAFNQIRDVSPLANLTNLTYVVLEGNQIEDISALSALTQLNYLIALSNPIVDKTCLIRPATACIFSNDGEDLYAKAEDLYRQGQFQAALTNFKDVLAVYAEAGDRVKQGDSLNRIGDIYVYQGNYAQAIATYEESLALREELQDLPGVGVTLISLAGIYEKLGQYEQAREILERAIANVRAQYEGDIPLEGGIYELPKDEGALLNNLALVHTQLGQHPEALALAQKALERYRLLPDGYNGKAFGERESFNTLGIIYLRLRQPQEAKTSLERALELAKGSGDVAGEGRALTDLGDTYRALGEMPAALESYQKSLLRRRQAGDKAGEGITLTTLGTALLQDEQFAEATQNLLAAADIWDALRPGLSDRNKVALFETQRATYRDLQRALIARDRTEEALAIAERGRARAFVELLASRFSQGELPAVQTPTTEEIRQIARSRNATLVNYSTIGDRALYIWVVQPSGEIEFRSVDLSDRNSTRGNKSLAEWVQLSRTGIGVRGRGLVAVRAAEEGERVDRLAELHERLIAPIADLLPADPDARVIFIPQDELFLVPFAALKDKDGQYLIAKHTLLTAPSIQVLALTQQRRSQISGREGEILVVGNPTMPSVAGESGATPQRLDPLPGAEREAEAIAQVLGVSPLIGDAATETAIARQMQDAQLIHLATHGLLDELKYLGVESPGAIALAPDGEEDGLLTTGEIFDLNLNAELVVLSACNTGRGTITGDGVIGLSRSFIAAGVPSIVVSLWAVPDAPTAELMAEFYRQMQREPDKARALRQAMLATLQQYPDPKNWAAFTLMGEP